MPDCLERFNALPRSDAADTLPIAPGSRDDYLALKQHHYRPGHPATFTRVLVIRDGQPSPSDRYLSRPATARPIAVLVESLPTLSCWLRDQALDERYSHLRAKPRASLLNDELRCISRVIIDPRWRGIGLAVRLVRHALRTATTRYTEALAVMGRVSPFFERAAMTAYQRPPLAPDERALAVLRYAGLEPIALATPARVQERINKLGPAEQGLLTRELTRWYRTAGGRGVKRSPGLARILAAARERLLAQPIYYLHENTHADPAPGPTPCPIPTPRPADRPA